MKEKQKSLVGLLKELFKTSPEDARNHINNKITFYLSFGDEYGEKTEFIPAFQFLAVGIEYVPDEKGVPYIVFKAENHYTVKISLEDFEKKVIPSAINNSEKYKGCTDEDIITHANESMIEYGEGIPMENFDCFVYDKDGKPISSYSGVAMKVKAHIEPSDNRDKDRVIIEKDENYLEF